MPIRARFLLTSCRRCRRRNRESGPQEVDPDQLFPLEGMQAAERKLAAIYKKMGAAEKFRCNYYDVPHSLNVKMQDDAIAWLERWLKK